MSLIKIVLLVVSMGLMGAQNPKPGEMVSIEERSIPIKARDAIYSMRGLKIYTLMRPIYYYADFDGDGKPDLAVWVTNETDEYGLFLQLSSQKRPILMGCGYIDSPWKDWKFDEWTLLRKWQPIDEPVPLRDSPPAPHPLGDYLLLGVKDGANAALYWDGRRFKIYTGE